MILTLSQLQEIALGAVRVEEEADGVHFYRFTQEQQDLYEPRGGGKFFLVTFGTSGVRLRFRTNSRKLFLQVAVSESTGRTYFSVDLFINGQRADALDNFTGAELPEKYVDAELPYGEYSKSFDLGEGEKEVCLYLPWSVTTVVQKLELDDGAMLEPVKPKGKMLCFGDSITMGVDALHPSCKYTSRLADWLGLEEYNKGIGGEIFFPELAAAKDSFVPELITVAYGTNDWGKGSTYDEIVANSSSFLKNLRQNYPDTPIYAITQPWRRIWQKIKPAGPFCVVDEIIRAVAADIENVTVISGIDLIPHEPVWFGDLSVHPSDEGFGHYFENLKPYFQK